MTESPLSPSSSPAFSQRPERLLTFASGGWVIALAVVISIGIPLGFWWHLDATGWKRAIGDGRNVETYGFDLSACELPRNVFVASGLPKDGRPAITQPATVSRDEMDAINAVGFFLVSADTVVSVSIGGETRAYPLRFLQWHEIVNDSLAGHPIAVTYAPWTDSIVAFSRDVNGETLELGVSGLLWNSNLVMYDKRPGAEGESLWAQLTGQAVAGPAAKAGRELPILPAYAMPWGTWRAMFPDGRVVVPHSIAEWLGTPASDRPRRPSFAKYYKQNPYGAALSSGQPHYPVTSLPPPDRPPMARVVFLRSATAETLVCLDEVVAGSTLPVFHTATVGEVRVPMTVFPGLPPTVEIAPTASLIDVRHARWFAWHAIVIAPIRHPPPVAAAVAPPYGP